jgi:hypothetical protein
MVTARKGGSPKVKKQPIVDRILDLSSKALTEKVRERFISCLKERGDLLAQIVGKDVELDEGALRAWLDKEKEILTRLEEERKRVLEAMEGLSRRRVALRQYSPKFPFPPMPVFFDKLG